MSFFIFKMEISGYQELIRQRKESGFGLAVASM